MRKTVLQCIREDVVITVGCRSDQCGHSAALELVKLVMRFGDGFICSEENLAPRLFCTKCGSRDVSIQFAVVPDPTHPKMTPEGTGTYDWWADRMRQLDEAIVRAKRRD